MSRNQRLSSLLRDLARLIEEEAGRNVGFAAQLEELLVPALRNPRQKNSGARGPQDYSTVPDVLSALEKDGEDEFRFWLRSFDLVTLKAIIKSNGFDVARASQKWTDPDKFINLIAEQASARLRRGSAFLPPTSAEKVNACADGDSKSNADICRPIVHDMNPRPASDEAIARGCKCTIAKQEDGTPILDQNGKHLYVIEKGCPIHD